VTSCYRPLVSNSPTRRRLGRRRRQMEKKGEKNKGCY
jgi:hypothetical protein